MNIKLGNGGYAKIDKEDYPMVSAHNWSLVNFSGKRYAMCINNRKTVYMHRLINATPKGMVTDHINGDSLDNRRRNLRTCTQSENTCNRSKNSNNKSGYKGVSWYEITKKWVAQISYKNIDYNLGYYFDKDDAARAYNKAAIKFHGKFARLNEII